VKLQLNFRCNGDDVGFSEAENLHIMPSMDTLYTRVVTSIIECDEPCIWIVVGWINMFGVSMYDKSVKRGCDNQWTSTHLEKLAELSGSKRINNAAGVSEHT
jgi:hypothetical protein